MNLCKCGDARVVHVTSTGQCAMCPCQHFVARAVDTVTTEGWKPVWMRRRDAGLQDHGRDESGYATGGVIL